MGNSDDNWRARVKKREPFVSKCSRLKELVIFQLTSVTTGPPASVLTSMVLYVP
jgi:hypothetical protein